MVAGIPRHHHCARCLLETVRPQRRRFGIRAGIPPTELAMTLRRPDLRRRGRQKFTWSSRKLRRESARAQRPTLHWPSLVGGEPLGDL